MTRDMASNGPGNDADEVAAFIAAQLDNRGSDWMVSAPGIAAEFRPQPDDRHELGRTAF